MGKVGGWLLLELNVPWTVVNGIRPSGYLKQC